MPWKLVRPDNDLACWKCRTADFLRPKAGFSVGDPDSLSLDDDDPITKPTRKIDFSLLTGRELPENQYGIF